MGMEHWWKEDSWQRESIGQKPLPVPLSPTHTAQDLCSVERVYLNTSVCTFFLRTEFFFLHSNDSEWQNVWFEKGRNLTYRAGTNRNSSKVVAQSTTWPNNKCFSADRTIFSKECMCFWKYARHVLRCWFYLYIEFSFIELIVGTLLCPEMQSNNITAIITISLRVTNLGLIRVNSFSVALKPKSGHGCPFLKSLHQPQTHAFRRTPANQTSACRRGRFLHNTHKTNTREEHPRPLRDSNPLSQQSSGCRPTP